LKCQSIRHWTAASSIADFARSAVVWFAKAQLTVITRTLFRPDRLITFSWHAGDVPRGIIDDIIEDLGLTRDEFYRRTS
jgi:hypothetical protein